MDKELIRRKIKSFVESGEETLSFDDVLIPVGIIEDIMKDMEFTFEMDGEETNGWQVDFWYYFNHPAFGKYCYQGSLFYGEAKLRKD